MVFLDTQIIYIILHVYAYLKNLGIAVHRLQLFTLLTCALFSTRVNVNQTFSELWI